MTAKDTTTILDALNALVTLATTAFDEGYDFGIMHDDDQREHAWNTSETKHAIESFARFAAACKPLNTTVEP